jgi:hypothetical protein
MARVELKYDDARLRRNIRNFSGNLDRNVSALMDYNAGYTTGWLKQNAPWHDNTGAARSGLVALPFHHGSTHELLMAYSVTYGIWLEVAHSGQWAIITPAMRIIGEKIMRDMQMLLDRMPK